MRAIANPGSTLFVPVLLAVAAVAAFPLLAPNGLAFRETGFDLHYLSPWVAGGSALVLLGRIVVPATRFIGQRLSRELDQAGEDREASPQWLHKAAPAAGGLLGGSGWAVLVAGLLGAVSHLPAMVSGRPDSPGLGSLGPYLAVFGSLAVWALAVLVLFAVLGSVKELRPNLKDALPFPRDRLLVLAAAYLILSDGGVLSVAFDFSLGLVLLILTLAMTLSYFAPVMRRLASAWLSKRVQLPKSLGPVMADCGLLALALVIVVALPRMVDGIPVDRYGQTLELAAPYLDVLDTLAFWAIVIIGPLILVRAAASFWPVVGEAVGAPLRRLALFGAVIAALSENGILAATLGFPGSQVLMLVSVALGLSYLAPILRSVAEVEFPERISPLATNVLPIAGSLASAIALSMVLWAVLNSLPFVSALLLNHVSTENFGQSSMLYSAGFFEARYLLAGLFFTGVFTMSFPDPTRSPGRWPLRPLLAPVGFATCGCLTWITGAELSDLGHGFRLAGEVVGAGLFSLALFQLAGYAAGSSNSILGGVARWLSASKLRGFLLGAAIAFYGLLLRPMIYDLLWFAAVYEWLVVLAATFVAFMRIRNRLKADVDVFEAGPSAWTGWTRHESFFEARPDPRLELMSRWRQRFVESGEWGSLWGYIMGLLCRNEAPLESAQEVFRPMRDCIASPARFNFWSGERDRNRPRRAAALAESLKNAEMVLSGAPAPAEPVDESALREIAGSFVENGDDPEDLAAAVIASYRRKGADVQHAVNLWFPLVNVVKRPPGWFDPPWVRGRKRRQARQRRERLAEGAISHLSGSAGLDSLTVAVAATRLSLFPDPDGGMLSASPSGTLAPGQGFELLTDGGPTYFVRTPENVEAYVEKSDLLRQPILPGDEVEIAQ